MDAVQTQLLCPLCRQDTPEHYLRDQSRDYFQCRRCGLVFVSPGQHLNTEEEKARYDLHQNSPDDPAYRTFLSRLVDPLKEKLTEGSVGLDFGSGPGPAVPVMFREAGYPVAVYDPFYAPDESVFDRSYDFITSSEVLEHLRDPRKELDRLWGCLNSDGYLGLMTKRAGGKDSFKDWHYKNDPTHICFYSDSTFRWLAGHWRAKMIIVDDDVVLIQKGGRHE